MKPEDIKDLISGGMLLIFFIASMYFMSKSDK